MQPSEKEAESRKMKRVQEIFRDPEVTACLEELRALEKDRAFCRHDIDHLLATARLAYIFSLERGYKLDKTLIYAAALLHDCGKAEQYRIGTPHHTAGAEFAGRILSKYDFSEEEKERIITAIREHRKRGESGDELSEVLYDEDQMSRNCFDCAVKDECSWSDQKKNLTILW